MDYLAERVSILERRLIMISEEVSMTMQYIVRNDPQSVNNISGIVCVNGDELQSHVASGRVHINADMISPFSQGFYTREYDDNGVMFRWTGLGPFCELRFFLDRTEDQVFRMSVGNTPGDVADKISGFVDYANIPLAIDIDDDGGKVVVGTIPKRGHTKLAVVTFLLGRTAETGSMDGEPAWLGFRFYAFDVR